MFTKSWKHHLKLTTYGMHLHDRINLPIGEVRAHKTLPTFYWSVCAKPGMWAVIYLCVRGIDFASFNDFWYLELFWQCGIFCFSFYWYTLNRRKFCVYKFLRDPFQYIRYSGTFAPFEKLKYIILFQKKHLNTTTYYLMKKSLNSDGHQDQQNEQLPLALTHWTQIITTTHVCTVLVVTSYSIFVLYYSVINWLFLYWPLYRFEVSCIGPRLRAAGQYSWSRIYTGPIQKQPVNNTFIK